MVCTAAWTTVLVSGRSLCVCKTETSINKATMDQEL